MMMKFAMTTVAILIGSTAFAQTQAPPAPAPAPGSPAIFKPAADLAAVLANANVNAGGM